MTPRPTGLKQLLMLWEELQVGTNADATQNVDSSKNDHPILAPLKANFDDTVLLLLDLSLIASTLNDPLITVSNKRTYGLLRRTI